MKKSYGGGRPHKNPTVPNILTIKDYLEKPLEIKPGIKAASIKEASRLLMVDHIHDAVNTLVDIMQNSGDDGMRMNAAKFIIERVYGRTPIEISDNSSLSVQNMTNEEFARNIRELEKIINLDKNNA